MVTDMLDTPLHKNKLSEPGNLSGYRLHPRRVVQTPLSKVQNKFSINMKMTLLHHLFLMFSFPNTGDNFLLFHQYPRSWEHCVQKTLIDMTLSIIFGN